MENTQEGRLDEKGMEIAKRLAEEEAGIGRKITGKTRLVGVMGWPIEHSLSPQMHSAIIEDKCLDWVYLPFGVHPDYVAEALNGIRGLNMIGMNRKG